MTGIKALAQQLGKTIIVENGVVTIVNKGASVPQSLTRARSISAHHNGVIKA